MNKAIKKFRKILERELKRVKNILDREYDKKFDVESINMFLEAKAKIDNRTITTQEKLKEETDKKQEEFFAKFKISHKDIIDYHDTICEILSGMTEKKCFWNYDILTKCLNWFDFSNTETLEIYAYFLNITITGVLGFNTNENEDVYNKSKREVEEAKKVPKIFQKLATKLVYNDHLKHARNDQIDVKHLRNVISEDGNIIPFAYATDLIWVFKNHNFKLDINIIMQILEESENRFKIQKAEEEALKQAEEKKILASKEYKEKMNEQSENIAIYFKERRNAIQELKKYLNDEMYDRIISDDEIAIMINLMKVAGYTETQIQTIKRNIIENNIILNDEIIQKKLQDVRQRYLNELEIKIFVEAYTIIGDSTSAKNHAFDNVFNTYNIVHNLLLKLSNCGDEQEVKDDLELLHLYIDELSKNIENYAYSDYRYALTLNKEGN